ncbi:MAG: hypothetical protein GY795_14290 [Desulfobacterales bacterium]|nr:hypothetical protein [Desulfobacterales bacterium]
MDYPIALSPELGISAEDFMAAWNGTPECKEIAQAELREEPPAGFPVDATMVVVFLAGFAANLAGDVVKDIIKEQIIKVIKEKVFKQKQQQEFEVLVPDGTEVVVVKEKE